MSEKPKVVSIRPGIRIEEKEATSVDQDVVASLEDLLARAKSGEVIGFAAVLTLDDGHSEDFIGQISYATIGGLESLKLQVLSELCDDDD